MPHAKGVAHTRHCRHCDQQQPAKGFRGSLCGRCWRLWAAALPSETLAAALHLAMAHLNRADRAEVLAALPPGCPTG